MKKRSLFMLVAVCLTVLMSAGQASAGIPPTGQWKFKGNYKNEVQGSHLNMSPVHSTGSLTFITVDVMGTMRKALSFTPDDGVAISRIPRDQRKAFTVDIMFSLVSTTGYKRLMSFGPNGPDNGLYLHDGLVDIYDGSDHEGTTAVTVDSWHHVAVTRTRTGAMRVYLDGSLERKYKASGSDFTLRKGKAVFFQDNGGEHAEGTVALIGIWDTALVPD